MVYLSGLTNTPLYIKKMLCYRLTCCICML